MASLPSRHLCYRCNKNNDSSISHTTYNISGNVHIKVALPIELCRLPQRPSLTLHPLGGSTPRMWPLFLLRAKGKRKEMTGTQHVGTLKHQFLQYITIKMCLIFFIKKIILKKIMPLLFGGDIYRQHVTTFSWLA
jgi:hypothetical protein